jgi:hypothetical protein
MTAIKGITLSRRAGTSLVENSDTEPRNFRANGTQLLLLACSGRPGQRWSLPGAR